MIHEARYYFPDRGSEAQVEVVPDRDPYVVAGNCPPACHCFTLSSIDDAGNHVNFAGRYYIGGTVYTAEDVYRLKQAGEPLEILFLNMKLQGLQRVVRTPEGAWQPFETGDVIL